MSDPIFSLIDHWRKVDGALGDWIHPDDRSVLSSPRWSGKVRWDVPADQREVIREHLRQPSRLQAGLIPQPYLGDLRSADIVLCLLNPGVDPSNYLSERKGSEARRQKLATLHQHMDDLASPFYPVDPEVANTGAFGWWWPRFVKLAEPLMDEGLSFDESMQTLSRRIACVEIVPYHSRNGDPISASMIAALPSSRLAIDCVRYKAEQGAQVILFRSHASWGLKDDGEHIRIATDATRSIVLGKATQAGQIIKRRLRPDPRSLTSFQPLFERLEGAFGEWRGGERVDDGALQMPCYELSEAATEFVDGCYSGGWILGGFPWPDWIQSEEGIRLRTDPSALHAAGYFHLAKLLTALVRADRFSDGTLAQAFESNLIQRIIDRAVALAEAGR